MSSLPESSSWRARLRRVGAPAWWTQAQAQTTRHWQRLAPRERRLLSWAGAVAAIALVWVFAIEPAWQTVTRLGSGLPALRAQAAQVDALLVEARTLQGATGNPLSVQNIPTELNDSLRRAGLAETVSLTETGADAQADTWTVQVQAAPIAALMGWMQDLPYVLQVHPVAVALARVTGEDGRARAGVVSGTVELARLTGEAR